MEVFISDVSQRYIVSMNVTIDKDGGVFTIGIKYRGRASI